MNGMTISEFGKVLDVLKERNTESLRYVEPNFDMRTGLIWMVKLSHGADMIILSTMPQVNPGFTGLNEWFDAFASGKWTPEERHISRHNAKMYVEEVMEMMQAYKDKISAELKATDLLETIVTDLEKRKL